MRTAKFKMSKELLFELIGLNHFQGDIKLVQNDSDPRQLVVYIDGDDDRLPDDDTYPECHVIVKTIQSHFEKILA